MRISYLTSLFLVFGVGWNSIVFAQSSVDSTAVGFQGTLTEATEIAKEKGLNFFILVWEDDQDPTYQKAIALLNDSTVAKAFEGKILSLVAHKDSDNGLNLQKQFGFSEFPTAMFVSLEGEELYTLEEGPKLEADQFIDLFERYVYP